jgi:DNA-binding winged helix-turn-helix (wHTH) protein
MLPDTAVSEKGVSVQSFLYGLLSSLRGDRRDGVDDHRYIPTVIRIIGFEPPAVVLKPLR